MKLETKYAGEITIDHRTIITFPAGIPGFEEERSFVLIELPNMESAIFQTLQSVTTPTLAFIVVNPYMLTKDYEFKLDEATIERLQITNKEKIGVFSIVAVKDPFEQSTLNLKAPIIINHSERIGKQFIIPTDTYKTKTPLSSFIQTDVKGDS